MTIKVIESVFLNKILTHNRIQLCGFVEFRKFHKNPSNFYILSNLSVRYFSLSKYFPINFLAIFMKNNAILTLFHKLTFYFRALFRECYNIFLNFW